MWPRPDNYRIVTTEALPCLPGSRANHRRYASAARSEAITAAQRQLCDYVRSTWIDSSTWCLRHALWFRCRCQPSTSLLDRTLRLIEACGLTTTSKAGTGIWTTKQAKGSWTCICCCSYSVLKPSCWKYSWLFWESSHIRRQRESSRRVTSRLFAAWDHLTAGQRTVRRRLTRHSTVFQPLVNSSYDFWLWRVDRVTSWLAPGSQRRKPIHTAYCGLHN